MTEASQPPELPPLVRAGEGFPAPASSDELATLRSLAEATARPTGPEFFRSLVRHLTQSLDVPYALVTEFAGVSTRVRTLAFWSRDHLANNVEYDLAGTPCQDVIRSGPHHHSKGVSVQFPDDRALVEIGIESYLGAPLLASDGSVLGHLAVFDTRPMPAEVRRQLVLHVFADRAAAELERLRSERRREESEQLAAAERDRLEQHIHYLREEIKSVHNFEEIVGQGSAIRAVLDKVRLVAGTETTVLILGETGTGKELIARAVHSLSKRREGPLIKVNCAALPWGLVESIVFGHDKGADAPQLGRIELADGGSLFLDEIGELPPNAQAKLLRLLKEGEFERVGSSTPIKVNVRVIATTNRDLRRAREEKAFREDLYYRLSVFPILLPPLRDRREDIPLLTQFLAHRFAQGIGKRIDGVVPATLERLQAYSWPGNVRELENVIERAVILAPGPILDLGPEFPGAGGSLAPVPPPAEIDLATLERNHIRTVLDKTRWVIDGPHGAARILGLHPNTLRSRLKRLGLQRPTHESP